ncbi:S9 family peptidase [candidate division GN15 bacterium]|uniref:prolyl oligopeptidase n=1 Tax=candidate division GN15 bacterium TaxID=2072418 RepID=A0A855X9Y4_9BACT|nr:MAG: S9 family peptidase [candidate division GN15 bacterium]
MVKSALSTSCTLLLILTFNTTTHAQSPLGPPPPTRVAPVVDTLHGIPITDPYRWLEDGGSPEVQAWSEKQFEYFKKYVDEFPGRKTLQREFKQLMWAGSVGTRSVRKGTYFFYRRGGRQNHGVLFMQKGLKGKPEVLLDPNTFSADGTTALDWTSISDDGSVMAYGKSSNGTERSTLYIMRTTDKAQLPDTIPFTRAASIAWLPDNSGFYYTRFPAPGEVPAGDENYYRRIYFHKLGADWHADSLIYEYTPDKTAWSGVGLSPDGRWMVISVYLGWSRAQVYLKDRRDATGTLTTIVDDKEAIFEVTPLNDRFVVKTNDGAPRYCVKVGSYANPAPDNWKIVVPEKDETIDEIGVIANRIIVNSVRNACSKLTMYSLDGKLEKELPTPTLGSISGLGGEWNGHELFYYFSSFNYFPTVFRYDFVTNKQSVVAKQKTNIDLSFLETWQVWYKSKDGTPISMFIVGPKGLKKDGNNPVYLDGYGGFNSIEKPVFSRKTALWLVHGGVYCLANLRGGAEYGEAWHRAGMLENKQNTFDDFIAAAEFLVKEGYTTPKKLCLYGGSNGGLLIGAVVTQRPDICAAAICDVPLLDMLRYHLFRIAKLWVPEYGSSDDSTQFSYILKYSPYQHVTKGTKYPAILFKAGDSDNRVDPLHARKMAALMQASTGSDNPILLRVDTKAGHGQGKPVSKVADEVVDDWSFVFKTLDVKL